MEDEPLLKKRKGGQQQRLQAHRQEMEAAAPTKDQQCLLAEWLKEQWAWGQMAPQTVQHVASLAKKDMLSAGMENVPASLQQLARLGTSGAFPNNCHRDLMAVAPGASKLPPPLQALTPLKVKGGSALQSVMPHLVLHHVWKYYQDFWASFFLPIGKAGLVAFWQKSESRPSMDGHWLKSQDCDVVVWSLLSNLWSFFSGPMAAKHHPLEPTWGCSPHSGMWEGVVENDASLQLGWASHSGSNKGKVLLHFWSSCGQFVRITLFVAFFKLTMSYCKWLGILLRYLNSFCSMAMQGLSNAFSQCWSGALTVSWRVFFLMKIGLEPSNWVAVLVLGNLNVCLCHFLDMFIVKGTSLAQQNIPKLASQFVVAGKQPWFQSKVTWTFFLHPWGFQGGAWKMVAVQCVNAKLLALWHGRNLILGATSKIWNGSHKNGWIGAAGAHALCSKPLVSQPVLYSLIGFTPNTLGMTKMSMHQFFTFSAMSFSQVLLCPIYNKYGKTWKVCTKPWGWYTGTTISTGWPCSKESLDLQNWEAKAVKCTICTKWCCICGRNTTTTVFLRTDKFCCCWKWIPKSKFVGWAQAMCGSPSLSSQGVAWFMQGDAASAIPAFWSFLKWRCTSV